MCKYCDNENTKSVLSYDNSDSMNICDGQYCGVKVYAELKMKGDMLMLSGRGGYRSESDCYYESQGLECDGEFSTVSKDSYIKIEYCPFCGKKLQGFEYEMTCTNDKIKEIKDNLYKLNKNKLYNSVLMYVVYEKSVHPKTLAEAEKEKVSELTLDEILDNFDKVQIDIFYPDDYEYRDWYLEQYSTFKFNQLLKCNGSRYYEHYSKKYIVEDEEFEELINRGLVERDDEKWKKMLETRAKIEKDIKKTNAQLHKMQEELKAYKKH